MKCGGGKGKEASKDEGGSINMLLLLLLLSRFSRVRLCVTPWTAAYQASPSMGFSRQEHWNGLPFPSPSMNIADGKNKSKHIFSSVQLLSHVQLFATPWMHARPPCPSKTKKKNLIILDYIGEWEEDINFKHTKYSYRVTDNF